MKKYLLDTDAIAQVLLSDILRWPSDDVHHDPSVGPRLTLEASYVISREPISIDCFDDNHLTHWRETCTGASSAYKKEKLAIKELKRT